MKKAVLLAILLSAYNLLIAQDKGISFSLEPSLGITLHSKSTATIEKKNLEWLMNIQSALNYHGKNFNFDSDLNLTFGQIVQSGQIPEKTQDEFILNIMPSVKLFKSSGIRLFLQTKAETQLAKGWADDQETNFADPLFLTHTLFIGNKKHSVKIKEKNNFNLSYGVGYSLQQIVKKNFVPVSEHQQSGEEVFINGPTAVFNCKFKRSLSENTSVSFLFNSLFLMKKGFLKNTDNSRFSSLLNASFSYKFLSVQYNGRLVYDKEISYKRQLTQTLVFGVKFDL